MLNFESNGNRRSKSTGLKSESSTIWFVSPNRISLQRTLGGQNFWLKTWLAKCPFKPCASQALPNLRVRISIQIRLKLSSSFRQLFKVIIKYWSLGLFKWTGHSKRPCRQIVANRPCLGSAWSRQFYLAVSTQYLNENCVAVTNNDHMYWQQISCIPKQPTRTKVFHFSCLSRGLSPGPFSLESSALPSGPSHLAFFIISYKCVYILILGTFYLLVKES